MENRVEIHFERRVERMEREKRAEKREMENRTIDLETCFLRFLFDVTRMRLMPEREGGERE